MELKRVLYPFNLIIYYRYKAFPKVTESACSAEDRYFPVLEIFRGYLFIPKLSPIIKTTALVPGENSKSK